jgi:hypothetical protein
MENKPRMSGFASMDESKQREIARKGGLAAHKKGTAHEFTTEEARFAGRKGGQQVSSNRSHMTAIGRLGGRRSAERRRNRASVNGEGQGVNQGHSLVEEEQEANQANQSVESGEEQVVASADSSIRQFGSE